MVSANNVFICSLCDVFLRPSECRKVFSSSSEFVLPLLKQVVDDVFFSKVDKLRDVFLLGSKLCGPWHRRLEAIDSLTRSVAGENRRPWIANSSMNSCPYLLEAIQTRRFLTKSVLRLILALVVMHYNLVHLWPWILHPYSLVSIRHVRAGMIAMLLLLLWLKQLTFILNT